MTEKYIETVFEKYDKSKKNKLNTEEATEYVKDLISEVGGLDFDQEKFEDVYKTIDKD